MQQGGMSAHQVFTIKCYVSPMIVEGHKGVWQSGWRDPV